MSRGFKQRPQGPGRSPLRTRSPLAEVFLAATSPLPSPSPPRDSPGCPFHLFHRPLQFAGLCNSDSPARHLDYRVVPEYPGKQRALPLHRSGADYPVQE